MPTWVVSLITSVLGSIANAVAALIGRKSAEEDRSARVAAEGQVDAIREAHQQEKRVRADTLSVGPVNRDEWNSRNP